jgi:deoxyribonuclease V
MEIKDLHRWELGCAEARQLQGRLAGQVTIAPMRGAVRTVAGLDCAFDKRGGIVLAAAVVLSFPELELIEMATARAALSFPYVPGLLSFREGPACLAAVRGLATTPDLFLIDGQGTAHPRRLGLASHLGLFLDRPTIGCAKSRLIGTFDEPGREKGSSSPLLDGDEIIGAVVRTRTGVKPLFVSPGHLCSLEDALQWALRCTTRYRLPEPARLAHQQVTALKNIALKHS